MNKMTKEERLYMLRHRESESLVSMAMRAGVSTRTIERDMRDMRGGGDSPRVSDAPTTQIDAPEAVVASVEAIPQAQPTRQQIADEAGRAYDLAVADASCSPERRHQLLCKFICFTESTPPNFER